MRKLNDNFHKSCAGNIYIGNKSMKFENRQSCRNWFISGGANIFISERNTSMLQNRESRLNFVNIYIRIVHVTIE